MIRFHVACIPNQLFLYLALGFTDFGGRVHYLGGSPAVPRRLSTYLCAGMP